MIKKKKKKKVILLKTAVALLTVGIAGYGGYMAYKYTSAEKGLKDKISELSNELNSHKAYLYVALSDIQKGDVLVEGLNVIESEHFTSIPVDAFVSYDDMGKVAMVDIAQGSPILSNAVTENDVNNDTREVEIKVAELMSNLEENDYVDMRIVFPDTSDYVVLPKINVKDLNLETGVFFTRLSESQIITLTSATVDAFINSGTRIYLTKYIEPTLQEASTPNYPVSIKAINLIANDPNVIDVAVDTLSVQARNALAASLGNLKEGVFDAVSSGFGVDDLAQSSSNMSSTDNVIIDAENDENSSTEENLDTSLNEYSNEEELFDE